MRCLCSLREHNIKIMGERQCRTNQINGLYLSMWYYRGVFAPALLFLIRPIFPSKGARTESRQNKFDCHARSKQQYQPRRGIFYRQQSFWQRTEWPRQTSQRSPQFRFDSVYRRYCAATQPWNRSGDQFPRHTGHYRRPRQSPDHRYFGPGVTVLTNKDRIGSLPTNGHRAHNHGNSRYPRNQTRFDPQANQFTAHQNQNEAPIGTGTSRSFD